jgi:hypothetical protein
VEVFANGLRNPYGITMHTNGKVYATGSSFGLCALCCVIGRGRYSHIVSS